MNSNDLDKKAQEIYQEYIESYHKGENPDQNQYIENNPELRTMLEKKFKLFNLMQSQFKGTKKTSEANDDIDNVQIADYDILTRIGKGGMGQVFLANQKSLNRLVALKILNPLFLLNEKTLNRFNKEAKVVASLRNPNIVPIHAFGIENNTHYISFDFIPGLGLDTIIAKARKENISKINGATVYKWIQEYIQDLLIQYKGVANVHTVLKDVEEESELKEWSNIELSCRIVSQVAKILTYTHSLGIIHRDIKPSNIIIKLDGNAVLLDFGITRSLEEENTNLTQEFLGTIYYSSPEQIKSPTGINYSSDIFSLGVTFYELLTLKKPFEGETIYEVGNKIEKRDPVAPKKILHQVSNDLNTIILKSIEKNTKDRYLSIEDLSNDINNFLEYKPITAKPQSIFKKTLKYFRRHPIVLLFIVLSSLGLGYLYFQNLLLSANTYYARSEFDKSKKLLNVVLKLYPNNWEAKDRLATIYYNERNFAEALPLYEQIIKRDPSDTGTLLCIADIYDELDELEKSLEYCFVALRLAPHDTWIINDIAAVLWRMNLNGEGIIKVFRSNGFDENTLIKILKKMQRDYMRYHTYDKAKDIEVVLTNLSK